MKIIAHIPAREGSKRLKTKNLLPMDGSPLLSYSIKAGQNSKYITDLYVNTESKLIADVAQNYGAKIFWRDLRLAHDLVTQDTFNYDFIKKMKPDVLVLLNPVCPLIETEDIDHALQTFLKEDADVLVTTTDFQIFALVGEEAMNFDKNAILPRTQDVAPVRHLNFAIGIWKAESFIKHFEENGFACLFGKTLYHPLPHDKGLKISDKKDFDMIEFIMKFKKNKI